MAAQLASLIPIVHVDLTLDQWAREAFETIPLAPTTLKNYRYRYNKHLKPYLGDVPMTAISKLVVQRYLIATGSNKANLALLSTLLSYAAEYNLIERNPLLGSKVRATKTAYDRPWLPYEVIRNTEYHNNHGQSYSPFVWFMATTGLRYGEALALQANDIERAMKTGMLVIDKSQSLGEDVKLPKSNRIRKVPYVDFGEALLTHAWRNSSNGKPAYCFPRSRQFGTCLTDAHGKGYTLHSLRYTYAYLLKQQGVHVTTAQKLLGHSTIDLTLNLYTKVLDSELDEAASLLRRACR